MSTLPVPRSDADVQAAESREFALQALDAIESVTTPDEAEALLARVKIAAEAARVMHIGKALSREWRNIEIKAERKWGELLGKADRSANAANQHTEAVTASNSLPGADRKAVHEARKLASVPKEVFEEYVETVDTPTKAGLLRAAAQINDLPEPSAPAAPLKKGQIQRADRARDRVENVLNTLDGMCLGLAETDLQRASLTANEEQVNRWLEMAERSSKRLRKFASDLRTAS